ncbi:MAG TPA: nuclear transport factor 2 family protein [Chloroflexota bacterium]|nr:nuclear transport factor 2 family protein [Chloroflexota bacterium]
MPDEGDLERTLLALEHQGWQALAAGTGAAFYQQNLTTDALMVFPFGALTREQSIEAIKAAPPWATFRIEEARVVKLTDDSAVLTYQATAQRAGQAPYAARMTTVFVKRDGSWQTAFHQQTPVSA